MIDTIETVEKKVSFVELFFDLIFVFAVTQVVSILHHGLHAKEVGQAILIFWIIWWTWTQFTWALNAASTNKHPTVFAILIATAVAFLMAIAVPDGFAEKSAWFSISYLIVRSIGLLIYNKAASEKSDQKSAVKTFTLLSFSGMSAVLIGGIVGGNAQYWFWGASILLDIITTQIAGSKGGWNVFHEHLSERHGLIVIIALGETLIVTAGAVSESTWSPALISVGVLAVAITCALWWSYFPVAKPILEKALESAEDVERTGIARDSYSTIHFPMLFGVILYAVALHDSLKHIDDPFSLEGRIALGLSLILFVGGMAFAIRRATGKLNFKRLLIIAITASLVIGISGVTAVVNLLIAFIGILLVLFIEYREPQTHQP